MFKVQYIINFNSTDIRTSEATQRFVLVSYSASCSFKIQTCWCFKNALCFSISSGHFMAAFAQLESTIPHHCCRFMFSCLGLFIVFIYCEKIFKTVLFTLQYCYKR